jgi:hypothetical protein
LIDNQIGCDIENSPVRELFDPVQMPECDVQYLVMYQSQTVFFRQGSPKDGIDPQLNHAAAI